MNKRICANQEYKRQASGCTQLYKWTKNLGRE